MTGSTTDTRQANKEVVRRLFTEVSNRRDPTAVPRFWAADVVNHNGLPGQRPGAEGVAESLAGLFAAFPDYHEEVLGLVAEDDLVTAHVRLTGTHRGPFLGLPATGRAVRFEVMETFRLRDGLVAEMWVVADQLSLLRQLGLLPDGL